MNRDEILEGVKTAIEMFTFIDKTKASMAELMVFYGEDDEITLEEAEEYLSSLGKSNKKAA